MPYARMVDVITEDGRKIAMNVESEDKSDLEDRYIENYISRKYGMKVKLEKKKEGCFIATAVYGSSSRQAEIEILRHFRDDVLLRSLIGRPIVNIYYRISPPLANVIAHSNIIKKLIRKLLLQPIIQFLKKKRNNSQQNNRSL